MKLANKIIKYRKEQGLTQEEFANKGGLTRVSVSAIESGRILNLLVCAIFVIAAAMEISIDELVKE